MRLLYFLHVVYEMMIEVFVHFTIEPCRCVYSVSPFRERTVDLSVAEINKMEITNLSFKLYRSRSQSDRLERNRVERKDVVLFERIS